MARKLTMLLLRAWAIMALALLASPAMAQSVHIVAVVNNDIITTTDVNDRRSLIITTNHLPDTPETQQKLNPRILDGLINETLQTQEAKRLSIDISDAEVTGAMAKIDAVRHQPAGTTERFLEQNPQLKHTVSGQIKAQLAWNKVIDRRIKRSVNIAQDEITRAQVAEAAAPGVPEVRIAAISIPIRNAKDEPRAAKLAKNLSEQLNKGTDFLTLARQLEGTNQAQLSPPVWVAESDLQPGMQQALRTLKPQQITQPLRSQNSYQLINLLDRRLTKLRPDATEVAVKQISVPLPPTSDKAGYEAARNLVMQLRAQPGNCDDTKLNDPTGKATAAFVRLKFGDLPSDMRGVLEHLNVGDVSDPLITDTDVKLVMMCERIEAPTALPPADEIKRKLYAEKLELEAEKYLRNLRRDAFIDIKGMQ